MDPRGKEGQVEASHRLQLRAALLDTMGVCLFIRPAFVKKPELFAELLNARYGCELNYSNVQHVGVECLKAEEEFNCLAGVSGDVPEFMRDEPLSPYNTVFGISKTDIVLGKATLADPEKAVPSVEKSMDYLVQLHDDILERFPAGTLPPTEQMTQRDPKLMEDILKGPLNGGKHLYTLGCPA
ncbi:MAG: hypothetical protein GY801_32600 [bacterium]|nr:hypothetical protein [bacterium]